MIDENIKPSVIQSFYDITKNLMRYGFTQRDIVLMIQDRTKPKLNKTVITTMLTAIIQFEKDFVVFNKIVDAYGNKKEMSNE